MTDMLLFNRWLLSQMLLSLLKLLVHGLKRLTVHLFLLCVLLLQQTLLLLQSLQLLLQSLMVPLQSLLLLLLLLLLLVWRPPVIAVAGAAAVTADRDDEADTRGSAVGRSAAELPSCRSPPFSVACRCCGCCWWKPVMMAVSIGSRYCAPIGWTLRDTLILERGFETDTMPVPSVVAAAAAVCFGGWECSAT